MESAATGSWRAHLAGAAVLAAALACVPSRFAVESFLAPKALSLALSAAALALRPPAARPAFGAAELFGFSALAAAALAWVVHPGNPWMGAAALAQAASVTLIFLAVRGDREALPVIASWAIAAGCAVAALAVAEALGMHSIGRGFRRPESTIGNRNEVAALVAICLPLAIARRKHLGTVLLTLAVVLCRTRAAWLGLFCGLPLVVRRRDALVSLLAGVACAALLPWPGLHWKENTPLASTLARLVSTEGTGGDRLREHQIGLAIAAAHPLGIGARNWPDSVAEFAHAAPGGHALPGMFDLTPHSDALRTLVEDGPLALLAWLLALLLGARDALRLRAEPEEFRGACAALIVAVPPMLFDSPLFEPETAALLAVLAGAIRARSAPAMLLPPRRAIAALAAACAVAIAGLRTAACWVARGGTPEAIEASLRIFPATPMQEVLGVQLAAAGRCEEALPQLERALSISPHHWHLAVAAARCARDPRLAAELREQALRTEPHMGLR